MLGCDRIDGGDPPQVENCPVSEMHHHAGKKGFPTIAYHATVNHTERVLEVTQGFPGAVNDEVIIKSDEAMQTTRGDYRRAGKSESKRENGTAWQLKGNRLLLWWITATIR